MDSEGKEAVVDKDYVGEATSSPPEQGWDDGLAADGQKPSASDQAQEDYRQKAEEYLAQIQRLRADFDNYRKRMMQEQARWRDAAVGEFIMGLLPVMDNFERALAAASKGGDPASLLQGIQMIHRQLSDTLARAGLQPMEAVGQPFNPNLHEAMMRVESGEGYEVDTVVEEFQRGYIYKGSVIRPALVKVAVAGSGPEAPLASDDEPGGAISGVNSGVNS